MEYLTKLVKSKMFWLGASQIVASVGMLATGEANVQEFLFGASGVMTIILRLFTTTSIEEK